MSLEEEGNQSRKVGPPMMRVLNVSGTDAEVGVKNPGVPRGKSYRFWVAGPSIMRGGHGRGNV